MTDDLRAFLKRVHIFVISNELEFLMSPNLIYKEK